MREKLDGSAWWLAVFLACVAWALTGAPALGFRPPGAHDQDDPLASKELVRPELSIPMENVRLRDALPELAASDRWARFLEEAGQDAAVYVDPRTGNPTNIIGQFPIVPGTGAGNTIDLARIAEDLGLSSIDRLDAETVGRVVLGWVERHRSVLGVDVGQLGAARTVQISDALWSVAIPQVVDGIEVRHARIAGVINHGNLVIVGTNLWSTVRIETTPLLTAEKARSLGLAYVGHVDASADVSASPRIVRQPRLEIVPLALRPGESAIAAMCVGSKGDLTRSRTSTSHPGVFNSITAGPFDNSPSFAREETPETMDQVARAHENPFGTNTGSGSACEKPSSGAGGGAYTGPIGDGLDHALVWTFELAVGSRTPEDQLASPRAAAATQEALEELRAEDEPEAPRWEVIIDARTGQVLAFEKTSLDLQRSIAGGVYPLTSTEICPSPDRCGVMQSGQPMPFADTGFSPPNPFTNGAGMCEDPGGTMTTTLTGKYVRVVDSCGPTSESAPSGDLDLGGVNGQHDCATAGVSAGDSPAARSVFYELNKITETARGWLPSNPWLQTQIRANVNINATCGAGYSPGAGTLSFYRSGNGCRNSGEIAGAFDHEWGHALDDNDAAGVISNPSEAYADIAAIYRLQTSCVGYGFYWTINMGCGATSDGTGFNSNQAQIGGVHCALDCSGVREADWDRHADHLPDTPLGFVCGRCGSGSGPCGRQVHCAAAPSTQAAWDFVARDLQAPPFGYGPVTAFMIGNKTYYQGSGNIGAWFACACGTSSDGCGAANAYMNWLAADDDNGNLLDGTPHMTALFSAFNRHAIACASPIPVNSGCAGGPSTAPVVTLLPEDGQVRVEWTAVAGATRYWVLRTEGHAGCGLGMARIASIAGTSYTDGEVANGRSYHYAVVAQGASEACYGPASACAQAVPQACMITEVPANALWTAGRKDTLEWTAVPGASAYTIYEGDETTLPGLLTSDPDSCIRWTGAATTSGPILVENPPAGGVKWFLIVAGDAKCEGPAGHATGGPRILNSTGPCP